MKGSYVLIVLLALILGCAATDFRLEEIKYEVSSFPFIRDSAVHLTLNHTAIKKYVFSKTKTSYNYTFVHVYSSSAIKFIVQELIIDIPEDTTFYYEYMGRGYSYGDTRVTEFAKFCNIPYDDLIEMANALTITVHMYGEGYTLSTSGKVIGLKEWLEGKKK